MTNDNSINVQRLVDGHLIIKNPELSQIYKISESNAQYQELKRNYANAFPGLETYNNVIEAADLIYASISKENRLSNKRFEKSFGNIPLKNRVLLPVSYTHLTLPTKA